MNPEKDGVLWTNYGLRNSGREQITDYGVRKTALMTNAVHAIKTQANIKITVLAYKASSSLQGFSKI